MRPIKFRAWDKEEEKMYQFDLISYMQVNEDGQEELCPSRLVEPDAFMQFTGLLDKNGKEIYEGDITENYAMRDVVIFHNGAFVGKNSQKDHLGQHQPIAVHNELEVIGNIYENPELLKETPNE